MTDDRPRLIEVAFPLKQASLDSVHEKNVRHGHISTLHIWPARRPLAACRAALIATLLPDPGTDTERKRLMERLAGSVVTRSAGKPSGGRSSPTLKEETVGGILHWGREKGPDLDFFREEIKKAYGGRTPRVLDPFAGGGAIPLEAMRLGCEVTAIDINPVAWFILKCTLEYPQKLAGQMRPLPQFAMDSQEFMARYYRSKDSSRKAGGPKEKASQSTMPEPPEADLSWHLRAWGYWVLERARKDLESFYPTIDGKPTVAYLWARTVTCKNCRATLPLLKTLWLCRKENKRYRLDMNRRPDQSGIDFEVVEEPVVGGNAVQRREHDRRVGRGTMSRSGAWCPVCGTPNTVAMTRQDVQADMKANQAKGRICMQMSAVVVEGPKGKEYRLPIEHEVQAAAEAAAYVGQVFSTIPFGVPSESIFEDAKGSTWCVQYGFDTFDKLFTARQLVALGTIIRHARAASVDMREEGYEDAWVQSLTGYLGCVVSKLLDYGNTCCSWYTSNEQITHLFNRFALPLMWDFAETSPIGGASGSWESMLNSVAKSVATSVSLPKDMEAPKLIAQSAISARPLPVDVIVTDPPYYDAIPYSNTMDFFHVWLRRALNGLSPEIDEAFCCSSGPKWDSEKNDGELVDDASRFAGSAEEAKFAYEDGMFRAFQVCYNSLTNAGRMVVVFANKQPDAWEQLVSAMVRAGFVVNGSWPIQTEMKNRTRARASAALSSSVWLVCRKRPETARPGWDNHVLDEMRERIYDRLRTFWHAGIRGPDFVWAATGPALEAYSKHPVVKKADEPNAVMTVPEFLKHVRRMVVDYVVGRVLSLDGERAESESLDNVTSYYLLHRHDFGLDEAPVGACILYAQSCSLRDRDLVDRYDLLTYGKGSASAEAVDESEEGEEEATSSGSTLRLKPWEKRNRKGLGITIGGYPAPLVDQIHRIMHLWSAGDVQKVDGYLEDQGLRRNYLFARVLQAVIELARKDNQSGEVSLLESVMNHITARGMHPQMRLMQEDNASREEV